MKPIRIFIYFSAVFLLISFLSFLIPKEGIGIFGNHRLNFITFSDLFAVDSVDRAENVEQLIARSRVTEDPETDPEGTLVDAGPGDGGSGKPVIAPANTDSLQQSVCRIQFAEGKSNLLNPFFRKLDQLTSGRILRTRILHFGDSQIENDRITALVRYRLQKQFGGTGTGLVQAIPLYSGSMAYKQNESGDWLRYTYFGKRDTTINHNTYGVMGAFASVPAVHKGKWPLLHYRFNTSRQSGKCDRIRVFMHSYVDSAAIVFQVNDTITDTLKYLSGGFGVANFSTPVMVKDLKIHFNMPEGGRIYGISFESYAGLQVDNIAMRGGSGLIFTKMNRDQQQSMLDQLSPDLVLLQFGGNVVPYMNPSYYKRAFKRELQFFKEVCQGVPVIVIGPADMSYREQGVLITYPGLEPIRDALKHAALESGYAFWDLYEAMGGYNSMPSFVHSDPPLASTDYIHFTQLGVNLVAEMFYNALMLEYNNYNPKRRRR